MMILIIWNKYFNNINYFTYQSSPTKAKPLDDVKKFMWFFIIADFPLFIDKQIDIDIGVDKIAIGRPTYGSLDSHQTMLFDTVKNSRGLQHFWSS